MQLLSVTVTSAEDFDTLFNCSCKRIENHEVTAHVACEEIRSVFVILICQIENRILKFKYRSPLCSTFTGENIEQSQSKIKDNLLHNTLKREGSMKIKQTLCMEFKFFCGIQTTKCQCYSSFAAFSGYRQNFLR